MHFPDTGVDVLVIGSVNIDTAFRVARVPRAGETVAAGDVTERGGGKGANQAYAAARHGGRTALLAAVGHDVEVGVRDLRDVGVDLGGLVTVDVPTGRAVLLLAEADNAIVVAEGANGRLSPDHVAQWAEAHPAPTVVVLQHEVPQPVVRAALDAFGASRVFLNPSPWREGAEHDLRRADVLVLNEHELAAAVGEPVTGEIDPDAARALLDRLAGGDAVVTLGARGALVRAGGEITPVPAVVTEAVDTVGAGDAFLGTLAAAVARGAELVEAAHIAAAAASVVVTLPSARDTTPRSS